METFIFENSSYIIIACLTLIGLVFAVIRGKAYRVYVRESEKAGKSQNRYIQNIICAYDKQTNDNLRDEITVDNVDIFVNKYIYTLKYCGFQLSALDRICGQIILIAGAVSAILSILAAYNGNGQDDILLTVMVGIACTFLLIIINISTAWRTRHNMIYFNFANYLTDLHGKGNADAVNTDKEQESQINIPASEEKVISISDRKTEKISEKAMQDSTGKKAEITSDENFCEINKDFLADNCKDSDNKPDRDTIKKAFTDAVYEAALEKMAEQFAKKTANEGIKKVQSMTAEQKKISDEKRGNELVEAIIKEMLQ